MGNIHIEVKTMVGFWFFMPYSKLTKKGVKDQLD